MIEKAIIYTVIPQDSPLSNTYEVAKSLGIGETTVRDRLHYMDQTINLSVLYPEEETMGISVTDMVKQLSNKLQVLCRVHRVKKQHCKKRLL